jgi:choline dehydrogenase
MLIHQRCFYCFVQVLFNDKTAVGVLYAKNGTKNEVLAKKEVVLAAGAVGSPHILLLSGIGPKQHLQDMGVRDTKNRN